MKLLITDNMRSIIGIVMIFISSLFHIAYSQSIPDPEILLETDVSNPNPYVGEGVIMTISILSDTDAVNGAAIRNVPSLEKGEFDFIRSIESTGRAKIVSRNKKEYYKIPVKSYLISFASPGKQKINSFSGEVAVARPVVYNDMFGMRRRGLRSENIEVEGGGAQIKVRNIPSVKNNEFSGAIGKYEVKGHIPAGNLYLNEGATVIYTIRGKGILKDTFLPDYKPVFNETAQLKSVSESRNMYFDGKDVISELRLECEFIPLEKNGRLDPLELIYFDPETGKYESSRSEEMRFSTKSITTKIETIDV